MANLDQEFLPERFVRPHEEFDLVEYFNKIIERIEKRTAWVESIDPEFETEADLIVAAAENRVDTVFLPLLAAVTESLVEAQVFSVNEMLGAVVITAASLDAAAENHTHGTSQITDLAAALSPLADTDHSHGTGSITDLAAELATKAEVVHDHPISEVPGLQDLLDLLEGTVSPAFTGTPTAPTATLNTANTQIATTEFVGEALDNFTNNRKDDLALIAVRMADFANARINMVQGIADAFDTETDIATKTNQVYTTGYYNPSSTSSANEVPDMTGYTTPSGIVTASDEWISSFESWRCLDRTSGDSQHGPVWKSVANSDGWALELDCGSSITVYSYSIKIPNDLSNSNTPKAWTLYRWNGTSYVVVDTRTGATDWTPGQTRTYSFAAKTARWWYLVIDEVNGQVGGSGGTPISVYLDQWELRDASGVNLIPQFTAPVIEFTAGADFGPGYRQNGFLINSWGSHGGDSVSIYHLAWKAFDREVSANGGRWYTYNESPWWLGYEFPTIERIGSYAITMWYNASGPKDWQFQYWSDSLSDWVTADTRINVTWAQNVKQTFTLPEVVEAKKFRIYITATNSADPNDAQIDEMEIISVATTGPMTLTSIAYTAFVTPTKASIFVTMEAIDTVVINTDFIVEVSRDGGTSWTAAELSPIVARTIGGYFYKDENIDLTGQPSGTSMKYRIRQLNDKRLKVHDIQFSWR
jgi:hypothetical protein